MTEHRRRGAHAIEAGSPATANCVFLHPRALETFRRRTGRSVAQVLDDAQMDVLDFRARIHHLGFERGEANRLALALDTTLRELATTSTVFATAERIRRTSDSR
ncbi:hypothetical protein ASD13_17045 [Microbacterium sp. Root1433D1]|uniref:hypothetical protein n=1 Tax=Microbacterium TaxID=33882 RepID=UPI0006FBEBE1|nr:hypothetical protein [Microbacterium sp. Root1433D1]KQY73822.1 hypothetical protein ASD13_17045 [Microbacterium sp. Root1433D1]